MAKSQWFLLLANCLVSVGSLILLVISFLTTNWIDAEAFNESAYRNSRIHYGLFSGSMSRNVLATEAHYQLALTCSFADNACMFSCQLSVEQRDEELRRILAGEALRDCLPTGRSATADRSRLFPGVGDGMAERTLRQTLPRDIANEVLPPGLWVATVVFMSITVAFAVASTAFGLINIFTNPIEPIWGVFGLYIWNGAAALGAFMTLVLWGVLFAVRLIENVAITDTLQLNGTYTSLGLAALGYSYWVLVAPVVLHTANCGLLVWRTRIIEAEPHQPTFIVEAKRADISDIMF